MDQRYKRVEMGAGAFHHPPKAKYSEETKNLIKVLMEESKVSMVHRKHIQEAIDKSESLPYPTEKTKKNIHQNHSEYQTTMPFVWKKRTQDSIVKSGAYEREQYRRTSPLPDKEKQKRYLASMMTFGKEMPETPRDPRIRYKGRRKPCVSEYVDPIDDLVQGIQERIEFLNDMECLGMDKKYRPIILQEIGQKLRLIESMDRQRSKEIRKEIKVLGNSVEKPVHIKEEKH